MSQSADGACGLGFTFTRGGAGGASGGGPPLSLETLLLAVNLLDSFFSIDEGDQVAFGGRGGLKVAGAACLGIAFKYEDKQPVATSLRGLAVAGTWGETELGMNSYSGGAGDDELHAARKDIVAMESSEFYQLYRTVSRWAICFVFFFGTSDGRGFRTY